MYKIVIVVVMITTWLYAHFIQLEGEVAMKTLFQAKRAVNRAAHAAAQQLDYASLGSGAARIDPSAAAETAAVYFRQNLQLEPDFTPTSRSILEERPEPLVFEIINADAEFPYEYSRAEYGFEATLERPGVIFIVRIKAPHIWPVSEPVEWFVGGSAELVWND